MSERDRDGGLYPELDRYLRERADEADQVSFEHGCMLKALAAWMQAVAKKGDPVRLTFICIHNSRRSQIAQLFAWAAATQYAVEGVELFSGGTEATEFAPPAAAALGRAGFDIQRMGRKGNAVHEARCSDDQPTMRAFSKLHDDEINPSSGFYALMACSDIESGCPIIRGSSGRMALSYADPKEFDGTPREAEAYDESCALIAREMVYLFMQLP